MKMIGIISCIQSIIRTEISLKEAKSKLGLTENMNINQNSEDENIKQSCNICGQGTFT